MMKKLEELKSIEQSDYINIVENGVYQHYKGDYYRVKMIAYDHDTGEANIIYHACYESGVFRRIYKDDKIIKQPFTRTLKDFDDWTSHERGIVKRFRLRKLAR